MKPFDIKGEYTPEEVKAALAGTSGTRQLSYRYERLDRFNNFVEDIDYVQSCTIENNGLAEIKRTAKLDILDTGTINYLHDRIKPYIRIAMPKDVGYSDIMKSLTPSVWWKMDDAQITPAPTGVVTVADGNTFNTLATADLIDLSVNSGRKANVALSSGTLRSDYYAYFSVNAVQAVQIRLKNVGPEPTYYEIYEAKDLTSPQTFVRGDYLPSGRDFSFGFAFPSNGIYIIRAIAQSTAVGNLEFYINKAARLEDSSGNEVYGIGNALDLQEAPALQDGGRSWKTNSSYASIVADTINIPLKGGMAINFWENHTLNGNEYASQWGTQTGYFNYYLSDDAVSGTYVAKLEFVSYDIAVRPDWRGSVTLPASTFKAGSHMVTVSADLDSNTVKMYVDGKFVGNFVDPLAQFSVLGDLFDTEYFSYGYLGNYSFGPLLFDDYTLFSTALTSADIATLYLKGTAISAERSGYVEWPAGVFLLSSPSRKMVDGNLVIRSVDGYDQLVILKEDSFDYRYSVGKDVNYITAIEKVLQTTAPYEYYTLNDSRKTLTTMSSTYTTILTDDSFKVTSPGGTGAYGIEGTFAFADLSAHAKIVKPASGTYDLFLTVNCWPDGRSGLKTDLDMYLSEAGQIVAGYRNIGVGFTYDPVAHAYWRIRESRGYIYWETSPDAVTWTQLNVVRADFDTACESDLIMGMVSSTVGQVVTYSKIKVSGYQRIKSSIIKTTATLPAVLEWEPGTPKLSIVNDMLAAINYESATYDEDGVFVGKPYITPQNRTAQFSYATDAESVITGDVSQSMDLFKIPNKWIIVVSEPDRPALTGMYVNDDPLSPTSTVSRGRTIVEFRTEQNAPDQVTLDAQAERLAFEASQVYEVIEFDTALMPIHQTMDVINLTIDGLEVSNKYAEQSWTMDLSNGATMTHRVRKVVSV